MRNGKIGYKNNSKNKGLMLTKFKMLTGSCPVVSQEALNSSTFADKTNFAD